MSGCGDDGATVADATTETPAPSDAGDGPGTIAVRLEPVSGVFTEGFEVGLRFETTDGDTITSTLWSDFVQSRGAGSIDAYYDSVLEQEVPAGQVAVLATVNIGPGGPPEVPDLDGPLRCRLLVDVPADGRVEVEVSFSGDDDCLRLG